MKRKIIVIMYFILALICILSFSNVNIKASTSDAYTIVANPGEDASVEMNISFHTDLDKTSCYVLYTKKSDTEWKNANKVYGKYEISTEFDGNSSVDSNGKSIIEDAKFLNYSVTLAPLDSDTEYMYRCGQDVLSEVQYFKTAGNTSFSFAWISDFHSYTPLPNRLKSAMNMIDTLEQYNNGVDFIFSTGDEIAWGGSYSFWKDFYTEENHKSYMWASVIGNHDYMDRTNTKSSNDYFRIVNNFPTNGYSGEEGVCYYFKYSNVLFIVMNNETQKNETNIKKAQEWFKKVVTENPTQYIIVSQHYQWFEGITGATSNSGYTRWKQLFDEYGVDLALSGNNHIYVRTHQLYQDKVNENGTMYIQAPSSDNERGQTTKTLSKNEDIIAYRFSEGSNTVGGSVVNVTEEGIKIELLDRNGKVLDSASIKAKREVYPMTGFDKKAFESNISYIPTTDINQGLLSFSNSGIGFVKDIKINNKEVLFKRNVDTIQVLEDLKQNVNNEINIDITYKDETKAHVQMNITPLVLTSRLEKIYVKIEDDNYRIKFNDNLNRIVDHYDVYLNDEFKLSTNLNDITITTEKKSVLDIITVKAIKDNNVISTIKGNYFSSVDLNCDGIEDKNDLNFLQEFICQGENSSSYFDINNDGVVDIIDATYISMYLNNHLETPKQKQFTVKFVNYNGDLIKEEMVDALSDATPPKMSDNFVTWDNDYHYITRDIVIKAICVGEDNA